MPRKESSWKYINGKFYTNKSNTGIWYIETNPCGCCPDSHMIEYRAPCTENKNVVFTLMSSDIEEYKNKRSLVELS